MVSSLSVRSHNAAWPHRPQADNNLSIDAARAHRAAAFDRRAH
jgi:hypothetical protein